MGESFIAWADGSEDCQDGSVLGYWGLIFWISISLYIFVGLYVLCEEFFVPTLTVLGDKLGLSEDVCGATLMAAGSSSPEFLLAVISTFLFSEENSGPASNCAATVFNMCVVIGLSIVLSGFPSLELRSFPFMRDSFFYGFSALMLYIFYEVLSPGLMEVWESACLVCIWIVYVLVAYFDRKVRDGTVFLLRACACGSVSEQMEETILHTYLQLPQISHIYLNVHKSKYNLTFAGSNVMQAMSKLNVVDEEAPLIKIGGPAHPSLAALVVPEAREDAWHFDTNIRKHGEMAGVDLYDDGEPGDHGDHGESSDSDGSEMSFDSIRSDSSFSSDGEKNEYGPMIASFVKNLERQKQKVSNEKKQRGQQVSEHADQAKLCSIKGLFHILTKPFDFMFEHTIPSLTKIDEEDMIGVGYDPTNLRLMCSFFVCIIWMACLSWVVCDMSSKIGGCLGISPDVMGLTLLAVGSSIPDSVSAILVAKQGRIGMAVSNALGCNVFGICVCVGFTHLLKSGLMKGAPIEVTTNVRYQSFIVALFVLLGMFAAMMFLSKLVLTRRHGIILLVAYVCFVIAFSVVLQGD